MVARHQILETQYPNDAGLFVLNGDTTVSGLEKQDKGIVEIVLKVNTSGGIAT